LESVTRLIRLRNRLFQYSTSYFTNKLTRNTDWIFFVLSIFDITSSTAAGATAAAIGALVQGRRVTPLVIQLGALGGFTQTGCTALAALPFAFDALLPDGLRLGLLIGSQFGINVLVVTVISDVAMSFSKLSNCWSRLHHQNSDTIQHPNHCWLQLPWRLFRSASHVQYFVEVSTRKALSTPEKIGRIQPLLRRVTFNFADLQHSRSPKTNNTPCHPNRRRGCSWVRAHFSCAT
jgi:hypothetical protein